MAEQETYLGDGLYASMDGGMLKLRAPHVGGDMVIYLEPEVFDALLKFSEKFWRQRKAELDSLLSDDRQGLATKESKR